MMVLDEMDFGSYTERSDGGELVSRHWKYGWKDPRTGFMKFKVEVYEGPVPFPQGPEIRKFERDEKAALVMLQMGLEHVQGEPGGEWVPVDLKKMAPNTWVERYKVGDKEVDYTAMFWEVLRPRAYEGYDDKLNFRKPWTAKDQASKDLTEKTALETKVSETTAELAKREAEIKELKAQLKAQPKVIPNG